MSKWKEYKSFEFNGSLLIPCFSIYVLEITKNDGKYFYIGMTGDPFYPSARAAFHRLSAHLEKKNNSKQNQLWIALREEVGIQNYTDLASLNIKMHHFPIEGYIEWEYINMHHSFVKEHYLSKAYQEYNKVQKRVLELEKKLIYRFKSNKLLNKTKGVKSNDDFGEYQHIYDSIHMIINA